MTCELYVLINFHFINLGLYCYYQHGAVKADVHTVATSSRLDAIRTVYGVSAAHNLIEVEASDNDPSSSLFEMKGYVSNANYAAKKITMVLFINGIH
jgi:DNA mismatch repair protein MLH1